MPEQYDLRRLERDLGEEPRRAVRKARDAVADLAPVVRDSWRSRMRARSRYGHIPHLPKAITADRVLMDMEGPEVEIGVDKIRTQGPLGNLLEFGSRNNKPHQDGYKALQAAEAPFVERIERIARGFL